MNKRSNPFFPQQATYPQPPLPPGPPPPQPPQYDYSAYWAAAQAAPHGQPGQPQPMPQWPTQPAAMAAAGNMPQVPSNQSSLYANYGYGGRQNFAWQRPPQPPQQPRAQFPIPQAPAAHQPYFPSQPHMSAQPGRPFPTAPQAFSQPGGQSFRPSQPMFNQPPPPPQHSPPHLPPAKRPRFDGPQSTSGSSSTARGGSTSAVSGSARGGPPTGPSGRGGASRGRGGGMGAVSSMSPMRGGSANASARGGRGMHGSGGRGGSQMGAHRGGRGGWHGQGGHGRRGVSGGGRGRGSGFQHTNHTRENTTKSNVAPNDRGRKEDTRQTLTDFRIVGLEIESLSWRWGSCDTGTVIDPEAEQPKASDEPGDETKLVLTDGVEEIEFGSAIKKASDVAMSTEDPSANQDPVDAYAVDEMLKDVPTVVPPPSSSPPRIRIYFNTPANFDDVPSKSLTAPSTRTKRKMSEDAEGEEGPRTRTKLNPVSEEGDHSSESLVKALDGDKEGGSVAPSVDVSATASVSGRTEDEGDWLMEAIGRDGDSEEVTQEEFPQPDEAALVQEDTHEHDFAEIPDLKESIESLEAHDGRNQAPPEATSEECSGHSQEEKATLSNVAGLQPSEEEIIPEILPVETQALPVPEDPAKLSIETTDMPMDLEHDPEPPASPASQGNASQQSLTQTLSGSSVNTTTIVSPSNSQIVIAPLPSETTPPQRKVLSANRVSISYASGARRILIDSRIVETMKIWRGKGRIDILLSLEREGDAEFKGLLAEAYSNEKQTFHPTPFRDEDELLPPWSKLVTPSKMSLSIYLDKEKPMSEPRWVKTGDLEEWLRNTFGIFWSSGENGWEKRIEVMDPDPPPTIHTVLETWSTSSLVGLEAERQRFIKTHMSERDNLLEILLRLVRGERATPNSFSSGNTSSNLHLSGPLLTALSPSSPHASQQTHLTLAIVAMVRMAESFAKRTLPGDEAKNEVDEQVGEIIRCLPQHLLYKSLDGIFREWKDAKKRGGRG